MLAGFLKGRWYLDAQQTLGSYHFYRPRSKGDNAIGSVRPSVRRACQVQQKAIIITLKE